MAEAEGLSFADAPRLDLDEALVALVAQAERVRTTQGRLRALLAATQVVVEESDLATVLRRIAQAATALADAEFGALGVIAPERDALEQFIYVGLPEQEAARIGNLPTGHGLLGALIDDPHPIRIARMAEDPRASGFPAHHPTMNSFLGVPVRVRDEVFGNLYLTNSRHGAFSEEDERLVAALATTAGFAVENARLLEQARTRGTWMAAAAELSAALLSSPTDTAFDLIAGRIADLPDIDQATILVPDAGAGVLHVVAARGADEAALRGASLPLDLGSAGDALASGNATTRPREPDTGDPTRVAENGAAGSVASAPLQTRARLFGIVCVARHPDRGRFSAAEVESLADLGSRAAIALELAYAREEAQLALLADDRRRIARDLHDQVIQQLFGTGLSLQAVAGSLPSGREADRLRESIEQIDDAISQIRTVVFALSHRDETSLRHRVIDLVADLAVTLRHAPALRFTGPVDHAIPTDLADDVVSVARELLSNAVRHSRADRISVDVSVADEAAVVVVEDDGVGMGDSTRRSGLRNLAERAARRGGTFTIASEGGTTTARWRAPLARAEGAAAP